MGLIKISRGSETEHVYENGISRIPILVGEYEDAAFERVSLQAGAEWTPEIYKLTENNQVFLFTSGKGYIRTPRQAYIINEVSVFVPEFDVEQFSIKCALDSKETLEILHIVTEVNDYDKTTLVESRMALPRFRGVSEAWQYTEDFTGSDIVQKMMLEHRNLGRLSMGANFGSGPNYIGQHIHNELQQWYIVLPGASFTYTAGDETVHLQAGDVTYTRSGFSHGSECAEGEKFAYIWFELCTDGYPGEIK
ncbi:MAG: cupin domain-containing protein [Clostridiaceae bacterium]|nr:cupin domain-containing protein [Clostridiaceae bacterium]